MQLTPERRSQLLAQLLEQMQQASQMQGNRSLGEVGLRLGTAYLNKKKIDKLQEEEAASKKTNERVIANAISQGLGGGQESVFGPIMDSQEGPNEFGFSGTQSPRPATEQSQQAALAQALSTNPKNPALNAMLAKQMQEPEGPEYTTKEHKVGDMFQTWEYLNGRPTRMLFEAPRRTEEVSGTPDDWGITNSQASKHKIEFGKRVAAINAWGKNSLGFLNMIRDEPGANTLVAQLANIGNRLMGEVKTLGRSGVYKVEDDFRGYNVSAWEDVFKASGLAGANARVKNGFLALAIQRAAAMGLGTGRALSDRDVEHQLNTLGSNQNDPDILGLIFADSYQSMKNSISSEASQPMFDYLGDYNLEEYDFGVDSTSIVDAYIKQRKEQLRNQRTQNGGQ